MTSLLYSDRTLATFYDAGRRDARDNAMRKDFAFCLDLASDAGSVLDLGCGTGDLALALAADKGKSGRIVGVDPAEGMLALARRKAGGERVSWVQGDARTVRLDQTFDLIVLTGHAFQVFLTEADRAACLATIAYHLAPGGRFVFDSRNPDYPGSKKNGRETSLHRLDHPELGPIEAWNQSRYDERRRILTYANHYKVLETGEERAGEDQIAYTPHAELKRLIGDAGLRVDRWLGDWDGTPFHATSYDIIPVGGLAS